MLREFAFTDESDFAFFKLQDSTEAIMNRFIQITSLFAFALIFTSISASAQSVTKLDADIAFDFSVGDRTIEAGRYEIRVTKNSAGGAAVSIVNENGRIVHSVMAMINGSTAKGKAELVFDRSGEKRVLSGIAMSDSGVTLPTNGKGKWYVEVNASE